MKRFFLILVTVVLVGVVANNFVVFAETPQPKAESKSTLDILLPPCVVGTPCKGDESNANPEKRKALPTGNLKTDIIPSAIKLLLMIAGSISAIVFVYAGVMLIISQGKEEEMTKFKNILIYSIVGLVFITASYALVRGVLQLVFK